MNRLFQGIPDARIGTDEAMSRKSTASDAHIRLTESDISRVSYCAASFWL